MGLFNDLFGNNNEDKSKEFGLFSFMEEESNKNQEEEMNQNGLEEWQKELVREGKYSPTSFEEDGPLEEDDYYYEDDK